MWIKVWWFGNEEWAWQPSADLIPFLWKEGELSDGQIWAQISEDGPLRPLTPASGICE